MVVPPEGHYGKAPDTLIRRLAPRFGVAPGYRVAMGTGDRTLVDSFLDIDS